MQQSGAKTDECFILIKALPHRSSKYFETVCCAGVGRDGNWRRQYPVPFRILNDTQKFKRWDWIEYQFTNPENDRRIESQKAIPETLVVKGTLKKSERSKILAPKIRENFAEADANRESLTLIRPLAIEILSEVKSASEIEDEEAKHKTLADQMSLFDPTAKPLKTCPVTFKVKWKDANGKMRHHECDDWETSAAYNKFRHTYGHDEAINALKQKYEDQYFQAGLVMAFSTHSRRNIENGTQNQWLLVGLIRLDEEIQGTLL